MSESRHVFFKIAVYSVIALTLLSGCSKGPKEAPPPPVVEVTTVIQKDVPVYREWIGTLDGMVNATIRAQVQGYLIKQNYREGDLVKKGQVLFEIDPRTFQAALEQAKGSWKPSRHAGQQPRRIWPGLNPSRSRTPSARRTSTTPLERSIRPARRYSRHRLT